MIIMKNSVGSDTGYCTLFKAEIRTMRKTLLFLILTLVDVLSPYLFIER